jgi:hypothetical protein
LHTSEPRHFRAALTAAGVLTLSLAVAGQAQALPKRSQPICSCSCDTGPNGVHQMSYAAMASCGGYNGKTCNVEVSPGTIRSGTLKNCGSDTRMIDVTAAASAKLPMLSADPAKAQPPTKAKAAASTMSTTKK